LDDDPQGNVQHLAEHGVTVEEAEEVLEQPLGTGLSRSSGRPLVMGMTSAGRWLVVVYEEIDADTIYPVTAYEPDHDEDQ
jgi:uncharacterized DUF497 family protein